MAHHHWSTTLQHQPHYCNPIMHDKRNRLDWSLCLSLLVVGWRCCWIESTGMWCNTMINRYTFWCDEEPLQYIASCQQQQPQRAMAASRQETIERLNSSFLSFVNTSHQSLLITSTQHLINYLSSAITSSSLTIFSEWLTISPAMNARATLSPHRKQSLSRLMAWGNVHAWLSR